MASGPPQGTTASIWASKDTKPSNTNFRDSGRESSGSGQRGGGRGRGRGRGRGYGRPRGGGHARDSLPKQEEQKDTATEDPPSSLARLSDPVPAVPQSPKTVETAVSNVDTTPPSAPSNGKPQTPKSKPASKLKTNGKKAAPQSPLVKPALGLDMSISSQTSQSNAPSSPRPSRRRKSNANASKRNSVSSITTPLSAPPVPKIPGSTKLPSIEVKEVPLEDSGPPVPHTAAADIQSLVSHVRQLAMENTRPSSPGSHVDWAADDDESLPDLDDWGVKSSKASDVTSAKASSPSASVIGDKLDADTSDAHAKSPQVSQEPSPVEPPSTLVPTVGEKREAHSQARPTYGKKDEPHSERKRGGKGRDKGRPINDPTLPGAPSSPMKQRLRPLPSPSRPSKTNASPVSDKSISPVHKGSLRILQNASPNNLRAPSTQEPAEPSGHSDPPKSPSSLPHHPSLPAKPVTLDMPPPVLHVTNAGNPMRDLAKSPSRTRLGGTSPTSWRSNRAQTSGHGATSPATNGKELPAATPAHDVRSNPTESKHTANNEPSSTPVQEPKPSPPSTHDMRTLSPGEHPHTQSGPSSPVALKPHDLLHVQHEFHSHSRTRSTPPTGTRPIRGGYGSTRTRAPHATRPIIALDALQQVSKVLASHGGQTTSQRAPRSLFAAATRTT